MVSDSERTLGRLFVDSIFECHTLEDQWQGTKIKGETRIPPGIYKIGLRFSPKFSIRYGHDMLWVKDVPGFEYILIHKGNTDDDTEGCILVGKRIHLGLLEDSKTAYANLYPKVAAAVKKEEVKLVVLDCDR